MTSQKCSGFEHIYLIADEGQLNFKTFSCRQLRVYNSINKLIFLICVVSCVNSLTVVHRITVMF